MTKEKRIQNKERLEASKRMTDVTGMCPMASMCQGIMGKPGSRFLLMVLGAVLVLGGMLILARPKVLFWLMAGTSILIGIMMVVFANFIGRIGIRSRNVR